MRIHQNAQIVTAQDLIQQSERNISTSIATTQILNVGRVITVGTSNILNISGTVEVPITIVNSDGTLSSVTSHELETTTIITEDSEVTESNADLNETTKICQTIDPTMLRYQTISAENLRGLAISEITHS